MYPNNGSVFYTDLDCQMTLQAVRVEAVGGSGGEVAVFVDSEFADRIYPPYIWFFPLVKGNHIIEFADVYGFSSVAIEVR